MRTAACLLTLAAMIPVVAFLAGCPDARRMTSQKVLLDGAHPPKEMFHVTIAPDPLAKPTTPPAEVVKVLVGGPLGPSEPHANKTTFIEPKGFFVMPASGKAELHFFVAMHELLDLKIQVTATAGASQKASATLAAADRWEEVVVALDPAKLKPGSVVNDITIWQADSAKKATKAAALYVRSVVLRF